MLVLKARRQVGEMQRAAAHLPPDDGGTTAGPRGSWDIPQITAWSQADKLSSLAPGFRVALNALLARMAGRGLPAWMESGWRPWSAQQALVDTGQSKVTTSWHNAVGPDLVPAALAADLRPAKGVAAEPFYRALRLEADAGGLTSGGWWGVPRDPAGPLGWDAGHVQARGQSLDELRARMASYYRAHKKTAPTDGGGGAGWLVGLVVLFGLVAAGIRGKKG